MPMISTSVTMMSAAKYAHTASWVALCDQFAEEEKTRTWFIDVSACYAGITKKSTDAAL